MSFDTQNITIHITIRYIENGCGSLWVVVPRCSVRSNFGRRKILQIFLNNDFITRYLDSVISFESRYSVIEIKRVSWLQLHARLRKYLLKSVFVLNSRLLEENYKIKFSRENRYPNTLSKLRYFNTKRHFIYHNTN